MREFQEATMGLFDQLVSGALRGAMGQGSGQGGGQGQIDSLLPGLLGQLLGQTNLGGIGGLLAQLQQGGLGNEVASWLGNGANRAVSPDQLQSALGDEQLQQMGQASGLPVDQLLAMLSQHLPQTIDRMSPSGMLQEPDGGFDGGGSLSDQAGLDDIGR
jgi:uncharacterized protein YidB (DUF937 family)